LFTPDSLQSEHPPLGRFGVGLPEIFLSVVIDTTEDEDQEVLAHINVCINNGQIFFIWIEYHSRSNNFSAFINSKSIKPQYSLLSGTMDLSVFFLKLFNPLLGVFCLFY
jgi:hypothetical protein